MRDDSDLVLPPHSLEAEQAVIGALLLRNAALDEIDDLVSVSDFYAEAHRLLFCAIRLLILEGKLADPVTVAERLDSRGELVQAGGMSYLGAVLQSTPSSSGVRHYANVVRDKAIRREMLAFAQRCTDLAMLRDGRSAAELLDEAQREAQEIGATGLGAEAQSIGTYLSAVIEEIETRAERGGALPGLPTGIGDLDQRLLGLHPGQLIIVAGRPSMGKSSLGMQFAIEAAKAGKTALVFSLEMRPNELAERALAHVGRVDGYSMRAGRLATHEWEALSAGVGRVAALPLLIDGSPRLTVERIAARARRVKRRQGLDILVVDYLQLVESTERTERHQQVEAISRGLKLLAVELGIPVIACAQLNRNVMQRADRRPDMGDLRNSGALEQDADVILLIHRDEVYNPESPSKGIAEIIIGKQRAGSAGVVFAAFLGHHNRFANTDYRPAPPERRRGSRQLDDGEPE